MTSPGWMLHLPLRLLRLETCSFVLAHLMIAVQSPLTAKRWLSCRPTRELLICYCEASRSGSEISPVTSLDYLVRRTYYVVPGPTFTNASLQWLIRKLRGLVLEQYSVRVSSQVNSEAI